MSGTWRAPTWLKATYLIAVVAFFAWALADAAPRFTQWRRLLLLPGTYGFVASWITMAWGLGALWALQLRWCFGAKLRMQDWLPIQAAAWGGRYLPGKLGLFAGKLSILSHPSLDLRKLGYSVLWEQLAFVFAGTLLALVLLNEPPRHLVALVPSQLVMHWQPIRWTGVLLSVATLLAVARFIRRRLDPAGNWPRISLRRESALFALYTLPHALVGLGCYGLLVALFPDNRAIHPEAVVGLLALANVVGVLAVFAPAGLGVREAIIALGLHPFVPLTSALAFAAVLRITTMVADAVFFLLAGGLTAIRRKDGRDRLVT